MHGMRLHMRAIGSHIFNQNKRIRHQVRVIIEGLLHVYLSRLLSYDLSLKTEYTIVTMLVIRQRGLC